MSSPSQIAEPRARPSSGLPGSTAPAGSQRKTYKAYGQEYQYAERLSNPPPEFVIGSIDPSTPVAAQTDGAQENNIENGSSNDQDGSFKGSHRRESIWRPPPEKPWYKKVPKMWWIGIGITVVGSTVVIMAILAAMGTFSGRPTTAESATSSSASVPTSSPSCTGSSCSATSSARPIPTGTVKECSDSKTFIQHVNWAGVVGAAYDTTYPSSKAKSAEACCSACYQAGGCGGWVYDGLNTYTPCIYLTIKPKGGGAGQDEKCPDGYADSTSFNIDDQKTAVGGLGPCSHESRET